MAGRSKDRFDVLAGEKVHQDVGVNDQVRWRTRPNFR